MSVFLDMMPRGLVHNYQIFGEACCPILRMVPDWTAFSNSTAVITSEPTHLLVDALHTWVFTSKVPSLRVTNAKF